MNPIAAESDERARSSLQVRPSFLLMLTGVPVSALVLLSLNYFAGWSIPSWVSYAVAAIAVVGMPKACRGASLRTAASALVLGLAALAALVLYRYPL